MVDEKGDEDIITMNDVKVTYVPDGGAMVPGAVEGDGWVEFDSDVEDIPDEELKQQRHRLHKPVESGADESGPYDVIPLSMILGGEAKPTTVYKKPLKHIQTDSSIPPRGWYKSKIENSRVRPRPCYTEAILTSPYGGYCPVGCSFCYINNGSRGYRSTGVPTVDADYPEKFQKQLKKMMVSGAVYMTSFSEVFHILEDEYHNSERLTQYVVEEGLPIFYCSRRLPPEWAIEALQVNPYSYMQWSLNTSNPRDYRKLSPGAASLADVMRMIERFAKLNIYVSIQCNPLHPGITTVEEIKELVRMLARAGGNHIIFKFAEQVFNSRQIIIDRLKTRRFEQERIDEFSRLFSQVIGGVYTIQQETRIDWLEELLIETRANGITMSTCYEYYADGKAGTNLAPYFTTSDQCHGPGVPVYYRPEPGAPFQPLAGCFRKGCLYCADNGTKACNNSVLQEAKALQYGDLRTIHLDSPDPRGWAIPDSCLSPEDRRNLPASEINRNPGLLTDAELWGWFDEE